MEGLIEVLYGLPVLGYLFQLIGYLLDRLPNIAPLAFTLAVPIVLGALCGIMNERSGIVNIGIEGMMLFAAFTGFLVAALVAQAVPAEGNGLFDFTPALAAGVVGAILSAMLLSVLHAWLSITIRADQIISGTIINILALGLTGYLNRLVLSQQSRAGAGTFGRFEPPEWLTDLPVIGWLFEMILDQGPIGMAVIVIVIVLQVMLFRSRWGLRTRAVGEHPRAADTVGIDVVALRYRNVIIGGVFAGLAGAWLTLEFSSSFQNGMTNGRGFIALAAVIFGRWTPIGALGAALLFTVFQALGTQISIRPPPGTLGDLVTSWNIPNEFYVALPYVVTIIVLAGFVGRSVAPAAVGQPYAKEGKGA